LREQRAGPADMAELDLNLRRCGCRRQRHCKCDCEQSSCRAHAYSPRALAVSPPDCRHRGGRQFSILVHPCKTARLAQGDDFTTGWACRRMRVREQGGADPHSMQ
jgi:hypothetical protein